MIPANYNDYLTGTSDFDGFNPPGPSSPKQWYMLKILDNSYSSYKLYAISIALKNNTFEFPDGTQTTTYLWNSDMNANSYSDTGWVASATGEINLTSNDGSGYSVVSNLQMNTFDNDGTSTGGIYMDNTSYIYTSGNNQGISRRLFSEGF